MSVIYSINSNFYQFVGAFLFNKILTATIRMYCYLLHCATVRLILVNKLQSDSKRVDVYCVVL